MKKLLIILLLLLLVGCVTKREEYYVLSFDDKSIAVGYDGIDVLEGINIDSYSTYLNKKEEEIIGNVVIYADDIGSLMYLDDYSLNKGIKETCADLKGELINNNGYACVLEKEVDKGHDYVIIYGDILDDDINRINRIEISYAK